MPVPAIVWAAVAAGAGLWGIWKSRSARNRIKAAQQQYVDRRQRYEQFIEDFGRSQRTVGELLEKLGTLRVETLVTLGEAVSFLEKARLKERDLNADYHITPQQFLDWKTASVNAKEVAAALGKSALSGVATASGVYGLVGMLASASTGTAISAISGAAATNATLAWLGGGTIAAGGGGMAAGAMVFGGLVVGPAVAVAGFVADTKAEKLATEVERDIAELDTDQAEKERVLAILEAVKKRIDEICDSTQRVHEELRGLLRKCDPNSDAEAYLVAKTASSLGELLEVAILDKSGKPIG